MLEKFDKNKNPFHVPENYFENLTSTIMNSLPEKTQTKKVSLWKKTMPWITGVAAAVAAILIVVNIANQDPNSSLMIKADESSSVKERNLVNNSSEYDEEDYYEFLEEMTTEAVYADVFFEQ